MNKINKKDRVGITSTIPVEILYAAQCVPVDLNNIFITDKYPQVLVEESERIGMPRNSCTWVKGIYSAIRHSDIHTVIGVVQGDCTHIVSMLQTLLPTGVEFVPFAYPYDQDRKFLRWEVQRLMDVFGMQWDDVEIGKNRLDQVRALAHEIDRLTWQENLISGEDNLFALINCTDFMGNPEVYKIKLKKIIETSTVCFPRNELRLGIIGVPGVFTDLYSYLESHKARVVYHEVARQFAMPDFTKDLLEQYANYTYPYSFYGRLKDIQEQTQVRHLDGYIHYVQSFCHHQLEDMSMRQHLTLPMLTLEGDRVGPLDGRTKTRLEAFLHLLKQKKRRRDDAFRH